MYTLIFLCKVFTYKYFNYRYLKTILFLMSEEVFKLVFKLYIVQACISIVENCSILYGIVFIT
jgi:hypothetical protein